VCDHLKKKISLFLFLVHFVVFHFVCVHLCNCIGFHCVFVSILSKKKHLHLKKKREFHCTFVFVTSLHIHFTSAITYSFTCTIHITQQPPLHINIISASSPLLPHSPFQSNQTNICHHLQHTPLPCSHCHFIQNCRAPKLPCPHKLHHKTANNSIFCLILPYLPTFSTYYSIHTNSPVVSKKKNFYSSVLHSSLSIYQPALISIPRVHCLNTALQPNFYHTHTFAFPIHHSYHCQATQTVNNFISPSNPYTNYIPLKPSHYILVFFASQQPTSPSKHNPASAIYQTHPNSPHFQSHYYIPTTSSNHLLSINKQTSLFFNSTLHYPCHQ